MSLFLGKTWWTTGKGVVFWLICSAVGVAIVIPGKLRKKPRPDAKGGEPADGPELK
jgi:hypothetical protein